MLLSATPPYTKRIFNIQAIFIPRSKMLEMKICNVRFSKMKPWLASGQLYSKTVRI